MIEGSRNGFLCPAGDPAAIASAIDSLLSDPERRSVFGQRAREKVLGAFSIQHLIGRWTALYDQVLQQPQSHGLRRRKFEHSSQELKPPLQGCISTGAPGVTQKILVLRLCPLGRFTQIVLDLKQRYPTAQVEILCQNDVAPALEHEHPGVAVWSYGRGKFSILNLGLRTSWHLRRSRFDLVVLPYNNPSGYGYRQAEIFACLITAGLILTYEAWSSDLRIATYWNRHALIGNWFREWLDVPAKSFASIAVLVRGTMAGAARARQRQVGQGGTP
jgi:hypothetical protein